MIRFKYIILLFVILSACSHLKIVEIDPKTGHFPSDKKVTVIKNEKFDLDSMNALLLVPNDDFVAGQIKNIKYFDKVMNFDELQNAVVREKLQEKIPSVSNKIGINRAYLNFRPFLWFRYHERRDGTEKYAQFILTNPKDMENLFIAEKQLDFRWTGVNDQTTWYPLFNAFIDYIKENSKTYQKN